MTDTRSVVVTGANKGIGFAITKALIERGLFVFLGSRDVKRGEAAVESLSAEHQKRVEVVQLDVTDEVSVRRAAGTVATRLAGVPLYGLVNNAGGGPPAIDKYVNAEDFGFYCDLNLFGVVRVTEAFLPVLATHARIVMISSGGAPSYVSKMSAERQKLFLSVEHGTRITKEQVVALVNEACEITATCTDRNGVVRSFDAAGLGDGAVYGLSKACLNAYTTALAQQQPEMTINACSPGFIETDLTRRVADNMGKSPAEIGCLPVARATVSPLYLLLDEGVPGSGWYFGSDAKRSPPHVYRSPGSAEYDGSGEYASATRSTLFEPSEAKRQKSSDGGGAPSASEKSQ